jgi:hypothetical protein
MLLTKIDSAIINPSKKIIAIFNVKPVRAQNPCPQKYIICIIEKSEL